MAVTISDLELRSSVRAKINNLFFASTNAQIIDYTLVIGDAFKYIEMNKATAINLTVPPNSSVAFDVGTVIPVRRIGAGPLTIVQGAGVTVTGSSGALTDPGQNVTIYLRKTGTDTWDLQNGASGIWLTWVPTFTGFSADPTSVDATYTVSGKTCTVRVNMTAGISNATTFTMTLPFNSRSRTINSIVIVNAGTTAAGRVDFAVTPNTNIATFFATPAGGAFTASGGKSGFFSITYEMP